MADNRKYCTDSNGFGVSTHTGSGIAGAVLHIYKHHDAPDKRAAGIVPYFRTQRGDLDGTQYASSDEARAAAIAHGYLHPYTRNCSGFVMSRAARKRGIRSRSLTYNSKRDRYAKQFGNVG